MRLNRRKFMTIDAYVMHALTVAVNQKAYEVIQGGRFVKVGSPLEEYPDRRWQEVYRPESNNPRKR